MLSCGPTGHGLWPLYDKDRSVPDSVASAVLGHIVLLGKYTPVPIRGPGCGLGGDVHMLRPWRSGPSTPSSPGAPIAASAGPGPHVQRGWSSGALCLGLRDGSYLGGGWLCPAPCPRACSDLLPGVRSGALARRQPQDQACWAKISIRWRDADPPWDPGWGCRRLDWDVGTRSRFLPSFWLVAGVSMGAQHLARRAPSGLFLW